MRKLRKLCNYFCYCGIGKDEYRVVKKDAYVSNFVIWRILHFLMAAAFGSLFLASIFNGMLRKNEIFYLFSFIYSVVSIFLFFILKKDSLIAQFLIYLSISLLFVFACFISQNNSNIPATTFIVFLVITPMLMIDKPFFMAIELCAASGMFLFWMHCIKSYDVWKIDLINVIPFTIIGIFLNIISNSVRIREFVLTRKINIQKDTDELTGLKNKGALTRHINEFLSSENSDRGIIFMMDVDHFKSINDTYGHDIGDSVICQLGTFLAGKFTNGEILGRFGGDEFIVFIKDTDDLDAAKKIADEIIQGVSENVSLPDSNEKVKVSIGAAVYKGLENNYSEIFKKADVALYKAKADANNRLCVYGGS